MKRTLDQNALTQIAVSAVYSRLTLAALNRVYVLYADLSPALFGLPFGRLNEDQATLLWDVLLMTMEMDAKANRPPLAALYLSRVGSDRKPRVPFFTEYKRLYNKDLSVEGWQALVQEIWNNYSVNPGAVEK